MKVGVKVIIKRLDKILLIREAPYPGGQNPGKWDVPGGTMNEGETIVQAFTREIYEEIGIKSFIILEDVQKCLATSNGTTIRLFMFADVGSDFGDKIKLSSDHDQMQWIALKDLRELSILGKDDLMPGLWNVICRHFPSDPGAKFLEWIKAEEQEADKAWKESYVPEEVQRKIGYLRAISHVAVKFAECRRTLGKFMNLREDKR